MKMEDEFEKWLINEITVQRLAGYEDTAQKLAVIILPHYRSSKPELKAQILQDFLLKFKKLLKEQTDDTVWLNKRGAGMTILDAVEILIRKED
jgi:hypothetical protein